MSSSRPHLLVALSAHGFGHTTQTAPVVNALRMRIPNLRITLRTAAPRSLLDTRFEGGFECPQKITCDIGMLMASAVDVLADESALAYLRFHDDWDRRVEHEAAALQVIAPDLVLANVPYLTLAGAARAEIPAVALGSLNWAEIYVHYCGHCCEAQDIHAQMLSAYNVAASFLQTAPNMPMPGVIKRRCIGPVARLGTNRRNEINALLGLRDDERLVVISPGGMPLRLPMERWPRLPKVRWVVMADWEVEHPDAVTLEALGMHFVDVLRSADALLGKPGYGSFAEAACNGVPVLYVKRHDWPEEPYLIEWLEHRGCCLEVERERLNDGDILGHLQTLWSKSIPACVDPEGIEEAADYIVEQLINAG